MSSAVKLRHGTSEHMMRDFMGRTNVLFRVLKYKYHNAVGRHVNRTWETRNWSNLPRALLQW